MIGTNPRPNRLRGGSDSYTSKIWIDYQQEFIDFLDKEFKERVQACKRVGTDWRPVHEVLTSAKNAYLEANGLSQCYSCNTVFEGENEKFCSEHCKQAEHLEVA